jgi:hypothetical protein
MIVRGHIQSSMPPTKSPSQTKSDAFNPLLGSWLDQDDKAQVIHFEPAKCIFARLGEPDSARFARASFKPGKISTASWGRRTEYSVVLKDGALSISELPAGKTRTYRKLEVSPPEAQVKPLQLGERGALPDARIHSIQAELKRRGELDQRVRTDPSQQKDMANVDAGNTAFLVDLVREVGWIDVERFGAASAQHAFLIVQHSGKIPLMLAALSPIEQDVKAKRLDAQPYALLFDRLKVTLGEKQRYGTQLGSDEKGELLVMPLEDRSRIEELRKEIGLLTMADYLKLFVEQNGGKPVRFEDD